MCPSHRHIRVRWGLQAALDQSQRRVLRNSFLQIVVSLGKTQICIFLIPHRMLVTDTLAKRASVNVASGFFNFAATPPKHSRSKKSSHSPFFGLCSATTGSCSEFRN